MEMQNYYYDNFVFLLISLYYFNKGIKKTKIILI